MNKLLITIIVLLVATLWAQTSTPGIGLTSASTASACVAITGAALTECGVSNDGLYIAVGSGTFQKVSTSTTVAGVTSVNGKTGAVVLSIQ